MNKCQLCEWTFLVNIPVVEYNFSLYLFSSEVLYWSDLNYKLYGIVADISCTFLIFFTILWHKFILNNPSIKILTLFLVL